MCNYLLGVLMCNCLLFLWFSRSVVNLLLWIRGGSLSRAAGQERGYVLSTLQFWSLEVCLIKRANKN
jgi:hypothetical protein